MGTSIGLNLLNFFAFKTEKVHFTPENRARIAKLSVPIDSAVKNTSKYVFWICGKIFWRSCQTFFKVVQSGDKNLSD